MIENRVSGALPCLGGLGHVGGSPWGGEMVLVGLAPGSPQFQETWFSPNNPREGMGGSCSATLASLGQQQQQLVPSQRDVMFKSLSFQGEVRPSRSPALGLYQAVSPWGVHWL